MKLYHGLETDFNEFRLEPKMPYITGMWFTDTKYNSIIDYYKSRSKGGLIEVEVEFDKPVLDLSMYDTDDSINTSEAEDFLRDCEYFNMDVADDVIDSVFTRFDVKLYNVLLQMFMFSPDSFEEMKDEFSALKIKENDVLTYFVFDPKSVVQSHTTLQESYSKFNAGITKLRMQ